MKSRLRLAPARRCAATVVFIHHYGGNYLSSHRHQEMVLQLGFNCFSFDLSQQNIPRWDRHLLPEALGRFGRPTVKIWANELRAVLDGIEGDKILYSFSYPSTCVPALLAQGARPDVRAWICDGGPFLDMFRCQLNLFTYGLRIEGLIKRYTLTCLSYAIMGGPIYARKVRQWVRALDPRFPILSLRAANDRLVPARATDLFFASNPDLNLQKVELPGAEHLEGLKTCPQEYIQHVTDFLTALPLKPL